MRASFPAFSAAGHTWDGSPKGLKKIQPPCLLRALAVPRWAKEWSNRHKNINAKIIKEIAQGSNPL
jgi:hypothetical protein